MSIHKAGPIIFVCFLTLAVFASTGFGYTETKIFVPANSAESNLKYYTCSSWTKEVGYAPVSAGANSNTGYVGVYSSAYLGGGDSEAWQCIHFEVPYDSAITADVNIVYIGKTFNYGNASFSGSAWQWQMDSQPVVRRYIDNPLAWDVVAGKALDIVLDLLGESGVEEIEQAVEVAQEIQQYAELADAINSALTEIPPKAEHIVKTFRFTADAGAHQLWVGLRGEATGCLTGSGFSLMFGQIQQIKLTIYNGYSGPPDLIVANGSFLDSLGFNKYYPWDLLQKGKTATFDSALSNIGGAPALTHRFYWYVREPNDANYTRFGPKDSADDFNPRTSIHYKNNCTFDKKGIYSFIARVDPNRTTPAETDANNNDFTIEYYVRGLEPNKPTKPIVSGGTTLYRNNDYTFSTSATDPENDPLRYDFELRHGETGQWYECVWEPNTFGWSDSNSMTYDFAGVTSDVEGTYYLRAQAIDSDGLTSEWSDATIFEVAKNGAPTAPDINAPASAYAGDTVSFTVSSSDREKDHFGYCFDWGDGTKTDYDLPFVRSGSETVTHVFSKAGTYTVQVQAKDSLGAASAWSSHQITITNYVPPPGSHIIVTTNNPGAAFGIYNQGSLAFQGSGTRWTTAASPGSYTIDFNSIPYYNTPSGYTQSLATDQNITFDGQYTHKTGTVQVTTNLGSASFKVTGYSAAKGQKFTGTGTSGGPWTGAHAGDYAIAYDKVTGYCFPATNNELKTLNDGQTITFNGRYVRPPVASLSISIPGGLAIAGETAIKFDGSASYSSESDLHIAQYKFDFGDGQQHVEKDTDVPDSNLADHVFDGNTVHVYSTGGYYYPALWVSDPFGNMNPDYTGQVVHVKSRPRAYISAVYPESVIAGEMVSFIGRATDADGDAIIAYEWQSNIDGLLSNQKDFSASLLTPGFHTISFRVEDSNNLWSDWADKNVIVYDALNWPMFKAGAPRLSNQPTYSDRLHGLLPYISSVFFNANGAIVGSPVAANLDGNSVNGLEVAFASTAGTLYVTNNAGILKWSKNIGASQSTPAIGDIDNDGRLDIVVRSTLGVYAYDCNGTSIYTFNNPVAGQVLESTPVIADIDANSANGKETVVGSNDGHVYAVDKNGNQRWKYPPAPLPPLGAFTSSPVVAEIEPTSPGLETIIAGTDGNLYVIDSTGMLITSFMTPTLSPIHTTPAIGVLNPNMPGVEIVFGSDDGHLYCFNYNNRMLIPCWQYPPMPSALQPIRSSPAIGFVAYNGLTPPVVFGCDDGKVYVVRDNAGQPLLLGSFQCGAAVKSTPAIANIDSINNISPTWGDQPEVIVGANDGKLYTISFAGGAGQCPQPWGTLAISGQPILSSPAIADIDHSPDLEILVGASGNDHHVYLVKVQKLPGQVPVADFTGNPLSSIQPLTVHFTDNSFPIAYEWLWNFGDGFASIQQNPVHTYSAPGYYSVTLTAGNAHGSNTITKTNYITVNGAPVADFTQSAAIGDIPFDVNFTDQSQLNPTMWTWNFGDGGTSNLRNPSHTYTTAGTYNVSLTAANGYGSNSITKTACIIAKVSRPIADFTQDVNSGPPPLTIHFTDRSTGSPASWLWNFGDGDTSAQQNPSHIYSQAGSYLVSLTVSNDSNEPNTKTNSAYIQVGYNPADFDHSGIVDFKDLKQLATDWLQSNSVADIAPQPDGDGVVDFGDFAVFAGQWLKGR